jgi:AraC-like DNA-binding protein
MRHTPTIRDDFVFQQPGFSAICAKPSLGFAHRHDDLELRVDEHAGGEALFGGHKFTVIPARLVVLWGAMPHKVLKVDPATFTHGIRVPMQWVLQWKLPDTLIRRLLNCEVIMDRQQESPCSDLALLKHWVHLMHSDRRENREIVLLEIHARLLRLAMAIAATEERPSTESEVTLVRESFDSGLFGRTLRIISERYRETLNVAKIAQELGVSRTHLMREFRKVAGITLLNYITQRRVSCAQRLMITTEDKILTIALESGFGSLAQFYTCFKRVTGKSPACYCRIMRRL